MQKRMWGPVLLLGVGITLGSLALAQEPAARKIADLIGKLGSGDFEDREQATTELDRLGLQALEALKQAAKSEDAEIRRRAEDLIATIEKREASTLILKPTRVTLTLKDAPVDEAIAALRKQTGFAIRLHDPEGKTKPTRVTLELKDATFWDALDALCDQAGLVEGSPAAAQPMPPPGVRPIRIRPGIRIAPAQPIPVPLPAQPDRAVPVPPRPQGFAFAQAADTAPPQSLPAQALPQIQIKQIQIQGNIQIGGGGVIIGGMGGPFQGGSSAAGSIVLTPGKAEKLPTDQATSFRIRAVPNQGQIQVPGQTLHTVTLDVTPEPRFQFIGHDKVTITRAIDDQDQKLSPFDLAQAPVLPGGVGIALPPGVGVAGLIGSTIPLYFKAGEKPSKLLKELTGVIAARIHVPHSKPIVVEKLLEASGKTVKGEKGGEIKILQVRKVNDTAIVRLEMMPATDAVGGGGNGPGGIIFPGGGIQIVPPRAPGRPPQVIPPQPAPQNRKPGFNFQARAPLPPAQPLPAVAPKIQILPAQAIPAVAPIQVGGGGFVMGFGGALPAGLQITDAAGTPVVITGIQQEWNAVPNGPAHVTWEIRIAQGKDQPKAEKLTWQLHKQATVDIPFTLKNVPLN